MAIEISIESKIYMAAAQEADCGCWNETGDAV